ncbi:MAG: radical SAM protein [Deltaproteobacteria bacterium]|nr:MAG: radical SAM protein [Deltaproteobacteria bacterium]
MRQSRFNIFIPLPVNGEYLLFNTFTDSRLIVNEELRTFMEDIHHDKEMSAENLSFLEKLKENGVIVEDEQSEERELQKWFEAKKNDNSEMNITILTTYACNLGCVYCFQDGIGTTTTMREDTCRRVLAWIFKRTEEIEPSALKLTFYGGEPLLNPLALYFLSEELYQGLKERGTELNIQIITNGVLLSEGVLDRLLPLGLKGIKVTLDGDQEAHDRKRPFRNGQGSFETIFSNLLKIKDKVSILIGGNYDESNKDHIPPLLDRLRDSGFPEQITMLNFRPIFANSQYKQSSYCDVCSFSESKVEDMLWLREETEKRGFRTMDGIALGPCEVINRHAYTIDPDGRIYKCAGFVGMEGFSIGDIFSQDPDIEADRFVDCDPWRECGECPYIPLCGGGCRCSAYMKGSDYRRVACEKEYFDKVALRLVVKEFLATT